MILTESNKISLLRGYDRFWMVVEMHQNIY